MYEDIFLQMRDDLQQAGIVFGIDKHDSAVHFTANSPSIPSELLSKISDSKESDAGADGTSAKSAAADSPVKAFLEPDDIDVD